MAHFFRLFSWLFRRKGVPLHPQTTEMSVGIFLTDLIITCPIGIPMIVHARNNIKHVTYAEKKQKFEKGLAEGKQIKDPAERKEFYEQMVKDCNFKDIPTQ